MKVKMKRSITGLCDGKRLPRTGECGEVETAAAKDLISKDYAEKCGESCGHKPKAEKVERATAAPGEKRKGKPSK